MRAVQVLPFFLLVSVISCIPPGTQADPSIPPPPRATVEVRNLKPLDFNLYVLTGTHHIRLGLVPGMSTRTFTLPHHLLYGQSGLRFQATPIGSDAVMSTNENLGVHAGDAVSLTIRQVFIDASLLFTP